MTTDQVTKFKLRAGLGHDIQVQIELLNSFCMMPSSNSVADDSKTIKGRMIIENCDKYDVPV